MYFLFGRSLWRDHSRRFRDVSVGCRRFRFYLLEILISNFETSGVIYIGNLTNCSILRIDWWRDVLIVRATIAPKIVPDNSFSPLHVLILLFHGPTRG